MPSRVVIAEPRGFCAGVEMAIKALTWMVRVFEPPVYCYHEIVHNKWVVAAFENAGVVFIDDIAEVPAGAAVMLSAHGSAPEVVEGAGRVAGVVVDAVCPLVTKVHHEVRRMVDRGLEILYVGHEGHDEAVGTIAEAPDTMTLVEPDSDLSAFQPYGSGEVALLAQTTLGLFEWENVLAEAQARFPDLQTPRKSDLCYATTNRQAAVERLAEKCDLVLIVGSESSSNTRALERVARQSGAKAHRIDDAEAIEERWLDGAEVVGVTAGASAPDHLVTAVIEKLAPTGGVEVLSVTEEGEYFPLPPQLRALLHVLQATVEAGFCARTGAPGGLLENDRDWTATNALELIGEA